MSSKTMKLIVLIALFIVSLSAKPAAQPDEVCKDNGANCRNWALNGFCTNCYYTCQQRRDYCARTCGFCHQGYICTNCTTTTKPPKAMEDRIVWPKLDDN